MLVRLAELGEGLVNQQGERCREGRRRIERPPPPKLLVERPEVKRLTAGGRIVKGRVHCLPLILRQIALLIRQDDARVRGRINAISKRRCGKCGDQLPVASCPCAGDSQCWATLGWHETKLPL